MGGGVLDAGLKPGPLAFGATTRPTSGQAGPPPALHRSLSALDGAALVSGTMIGSGIFVTPALVLRHAGSPGWALAIWVLAGLLSLGGALCYAELGAALPSSGGEYVYFGAGLGRGAAFVFAWTQLVVLKPTTLALSSIVFARFFSAGLLGVSPAARDLDGRPQLKAAALAALALLTVVHALGVRSGARVQRWLTALKLLVLGAMVVAGLSIGLGQPLAPPAARTMLPAAVSHSSALALIAALWTFSGWNTLNCVAEELQAPGRNLPRAVAVAVAGVTVVYLLVNIAYLVVLGPSEMSGSEVVALTYSRRVFGPMGAQVVPLAVALSALGSTSGSVLSGSRVTFAAARDRVLPRSLAGLQPRTGAPIRALIFQAALASGMVLVGSFESLLDYFAFAGWLFFGLAAVSLMRLRRSRPDLTRPYRVRPYPLLPLAFAAACAALLGVTLWSAPRHALLALGCMAAALPVHAFMARRGRLGAAPTPGV